MNRSPCKTIRAPRGSENWGYYFADHSILRSILCPAFYGNYHTGNYPKVPPGEWLKGLSCHTMLGGLEFRVQGLKVHFATLLVWILPKDVIPFPARFRKDRQETSYPLGLYWAILKLHWGCIWVMLGLHWGNMRMTFCKQGQKQLLICVVDCIEPKTSKTQSSNHSPSDTQLRHCSWT